MTCKLLEEVKELLTRNNISEIKKTDDLQLITILLTQLSN